ncbi:FBP domain-containing protein [Pseudobacteriovorax antillogorgiicola]|uniref:FBP C-terminal treble-clef zinc-finger n=1 Tax=Pseudobacteriovorax antillogorgiicola TaxID=1513793 RepID=A0A1Y6BRC0_9BACT|nr:FBP domain-containing protein [Pseudobacteriovorax antillogorgiicola]TCS55336.1 treble-clef zinc-finger protein [Pseudobacteriovorax antillogorgiicola]SMF14019.1 FBP C-terminal treble-clef zinc-finger [Pseudobacteriovorax antillogorgiicola]
MNQYSMTDIRAAFIPDDRKDWVDPEIHRIVWDDIDFLAWKHPKAGNYYACVESGGELLGFVLSMNTGNGSSAVSCDLCFANNDDVGVKAALIETLENPKRKIGIHCCADMACSARVRGLSQGIFMYETITVGRRIERLQDKMMRFAKRVYGISPSP